MEGVRLRIIAGPTAAGKSTLATALAQETGATIISADSRQIYRRFDIGTAKPGPNDLASVPHVGIDVVEPTERFSAARFAELARSTIAEHAHIDRPVLVVGGTGFYIGALVQPLFREPPLDATRRADLANYLATLDSERLRAWCRALDPERSTLGRAQLLRAIELATLTGRRASDLFRDSAVTAPYVPRYLIVDPGASLEQAIEARVDDMLRRGWLDEVRSLVASVPASAPAWNATGYAALRRYVEAEQGGGGEIAAGDFAALRSAVIVATRQYAKRQRTWLRHQLRGDIVRLDPNEGIALQRALEWWHGGGA